MPASERPSLNTKIKHLLDENPIELIVDLDDEKFELEKWVANEGAFYMEFDSKIRK